MLAWSSCNAATMPIARALPEVEPTDRSSARAVATSPVPHSAASKRAASGTTCPVAAHDSRAADSDVVARRAWARISGTACTPDLASDQRAGGQGARNHVVAGGREPRPFAEQRACRPCFARDEGHDGRPGALGVHADLGGRQLPQDTSSGCQPTRVRSREVPGARVEPARRHPHVGADPQNALAYDDGGVAADRRERSGDDHGERKPNGGRGHEGQDTRGLDHVET